MELTFREFVLALIFHNVPIFMLLVGLLIIFLSNKNALDKRQNKTLITVAVALVGLTIIDALEIYFSCPLFTTKNIGRTIFSMLGYGLRPLLILAITNLTITDWKTKLIIWTPSIFMFFISIISIWTGWICYFDAENVYHEGSLHFLVIVISLINIGILVWSLFPLFKRKRYEEVIFVIFLTLCIVVGTIFDLYMENGFFFKLADLGGCIGLSFLYIYLHLVTSRRDQLTQLYNRQSFYNDISKSEKAITAIISIDMNGLKTLNDTYGHASGDLALKTISEKFDLVSTKNATPYRIGGDEFVFLCLKMKEFEVEDLIAKIQEELNKTAYFCAIGYSMVKKKTIEDTIIKADAKMYEKKRKFKLEKKQLEKMNAEGTK